MDLPNEDAWCTAENEQHSKVPPLVSVVVVCFNHRSYVGKCLDSISNQTYTDIEIYVVDNGSTDGTVDVLNDLKKRYDFNLVLNHPGPTRLVDSLNAIAPVLMGSLLCFVSADDYWVEDKIRLQVEMFENNPCLGACSGKMAAVDHHGNLIFGDDEMYQRSIGFDDLLYDRYYFPAPVAMVRRDAIDSVGWYDPQLTIEDYQLWLKISFKGWTLEFLNLELGYYRRHGTNISNRAVFMYEEAMKTLHKYRDLEGFQSAYSRHFIRCFSSICEENKRYAFAMLPTLVRVSSISLFVRMAMKLLCPKFALRWRKVCIAMAYSAWHKIFRPRC